MSSTSVLIIRFRRLLSLVALAALAACSGGGSGDGGTGGTAGGSTTTGGVGGGTTGGTTSGGSTTGNSTTGGTSTGSTTGGTSTGGTTGGSTSGGSTTGTTGGAVSFPTDFQIPFFSSGMGSYLASSSQPSMINQFSTVDLSSGLQILSGEYKNNQVTNLRPAQFVYWDGSNYSRIDLRSPNASPVKFATDASVNCGINSVFQDYSNPLHSWLFFETAGPDGQCYTDDDINKAVRLDDSLTTGARDVGALNFPLRAFYSDTGTLTAFMLTTVGASTGNTELRYYDATDTSLATSKSITTDANQNGVRNVTFGRTNANAFFRYNTNNAGGTIVSVTAAGSPSTYYASSSTIGAVFADTDALFALIANKIVRISGTSPGQGISAPSQAIYSGIGSIQSFVGVTDNSVVITESLSNGTTNLLAIEKKTGASIVKIANAPSGFAATALFDDTQYLFLSANPTVRNDRILWTAYGAGDASNRPTSTRAGITKDDGTAVEIHENSEWVIPDSFENVDLSQRRAQPGRYAAMVQNYNGPYNTNGHLGGNVVTYDFSANTTKTIGTITSAIQLASANLPLGLIDAFYLTSSGRTDSDVVYFNLPSTALSFVTNTPNSSEH